ncbi:hypothetical protein ACQ4M3_13805 [Leptolyngbya sp. AN03gr2]
MTFPKNFKIFYFVDRSESCPRAFYNLKNNPNQYTPYNASLRERKHKYKYLLTNELSQKAIAE